MMVDTNEQAKKMKNFKDPEKTTFMAANAAREALDEAGLSPDQVDVIIVATVTPDYIFPSTACLVQEARCY